MFRRMAAKHPWILEAARDVFGMYSHANSPGTLKDMALIADVRPAPPYSHPDRAAWKERVHAHGPIGLLLYSAAHDRVVVDHNFRCHQQKERSFSITDTPYQFLRLHVQQAISVSRTAIVCEERSLLKGTEEIDFELLRKALRTCEPELLKWLKSHLSLSGWTADKLFACGQHADGSCPCGHSVQTLTHLIWHCPLHGEARLQEPCIVKLRELPPPPSLLLGLPGC